MYTTLSFRFIVYFLFVVKFRGVSSKNLQLEIGNQCPLKGGGEGLCKFLTDCEPSLELLKTGMYPDQLCGFKGTQVIVCCTDTSSEEKPTPVVTEPTPEVTEATPAVTKDKPTEATKPPASGSNRTPGEITKTKCKEYAQYAYDRSESPVLSLTTRFSNTLECGFEKLTLIVGGTMASRLEFPHMALIGYQSGTEIDWSCGGSIISESFILTAAHCLESPDLGSAKFVRVGLSNQTDTTNMQERTISERIAHPEYTDTKYHDIALLKLSENLDLNIYARPACLHSEKSISTKRAIASGWGKISYVGPHSKDLLKVVLEFFDVETCNNTYKRTINARDSALQDGILEDLMLCAGSKSDFKDTCQGDSGGPLQVYHENTKDIKCMYNIVGVTSFGKSCGLAKNVPGIYTRVSAYLKWIEDTVWPQ